MFINGFKLLVLLTGIGGGIKYSVQFDWRFLSYYKGLAVPLMCVSLAVLLGICMIKNRRRIVYYEYNDGVCPYHGQQKIYCPGCHH